MGAYYVDLLANDSDATAFKDSYAKVSNIESYFSDAAVYSEDITKELPEMKLVTDLFDDKNNLDIKQLIKMQLEYDYLVNEMPAIEGKIIQGIEKVSEGWTADMWNDPNIAAGDKAITEAKKILSQQKGIQSMGAFERNWLALIDAIVATTDSLENVAGLFTSSSAVASGSTYSKIVAAYAVDGMSSIGDEIKVAQYVMNKAKNIATVVNDPTSLKSKTPLEMLNDIQIEVTNLVGIAGYDRFGAAGSILKKFYPNIRRR